MLGLQQQYPKQSGELFHASGSTEKDFTISTAATTGIVPFLQAAVAVAVSAEVLVAVGDVLEQVSAVPFPGTVCSS